MTDAGLSPVNEIGVGDAEAIAAEALQTIEVRIANLVDRDRKHRFLEDIRPFQREIWKSPQIVYSPNVDDQPATVIDDDAIRAAGGKLAGRMQAMVRTVVGRGCRR